MTARIPREIADQVAKLYPVSPAEVYRQARRQAAAERTDAHETHAGLERLDQWMSQEHDGVRGMK